MKKFLVIADRQEEQTALQKACELARTSDATIHVAVFCYDSLAELEEVDFDAAALKQGLMQELQNWWQIHLDANADGQKISFEVIWQKNMYEWILASCRSHQYDLIIKTGNRSEGIFYTPTDWLLFRDSPVPVYIVAKHHLHAQKSVLVALDVLSKSEEKQALNSQLLECAFRLAVQTDAKLHCASVIKVPSVLRELDLVDPHGYCRKLEEKVKTQLAQLVQDYEVPADCIHIEEGEPWGALSNLAKQLYCQCLVVGSMGRKGLVGKLIGNTAEKIIHVTNTDLLVISPEVKVNI
jgi:universal stress protein E